MKLLLRRKNVKVYGVIVFIRLIFTNASYQLVRLVRQFRLLI